MSTNNLTMSWKKQALLIRVGADNFCANIDVALTHVASLEK
ncbi:hypothetical protein [Streptococcus constellatus]|nr:hypothetical protein [Streptococcus constellatus]